MKTLQIPKGYEFDRIENGEIILKKGDILSKINSVEDAIEELGQKDNEVQNLKSLYALKRNTNLDCNYLITYQELVVITKALNEGWVPDYSDHKQGKYEVWAGINSAGLLFSHSDYVPSATIASLGARLCYRDKRTVDHSRKTFENLWFKHLLEIDNIK